MRRLTNFIVAFIVLLPSLALSQELGLMRLRLIQGSVQIMNQETGDWAPASINMPLNEGDRLWVPENSRLEIQVHGGVYIRADEQSSIDILSLSSDAMQLYMDHGHLYIHNRRGGIQTVQIDTPQSSIRSYDNSIMLLDVEEDSTTEVQSLKGYVYAESREGKTRISSGSALTLRPDGTAELAPIGTSDEWETWNRDLDLQLMTVGESSRYLPDALQQYSSDFDQNGRWIYVNEYGYIWNPTVIASEWAPYREGYWRLISGHYAWISHEPWGWVPFHYGRWAHVMGIGWCWVPPSIDDIYWGPGYVGWVNTPEYVAWVPLAPGEIYYGYGYYGPRSVNITTIGINAIVAKPFINAPIFHSVTVVKRDAFGTRRPVPLQPRENPFLKHRDGYIPPPPAMHPEKPLPIHPRIVEPAAKQPPERIQRIKPAEIKRERQLVKEREASVFKQQPQKPLPLKQLKEPKVINRNIKPPAPQDKKEKPRKKETGDDKERVR